MVGVAEAVGLLGSMMSIVDQIKRLADAAQRNREKCALLKDHVQMNKLLLNELKSQWMPDPVTYSTLKHLEDALNDGKVLVESCREKRTWSLVFKTQKKAKKIVAVDARISKILESFHIANTILIVSINKERFFMNVLEKLLRNGACRRLPQREKEELKSSIKNLTNMDNMSSEAKSVMELIISDLTDGDEKAARSSAFSVGPGGRGDQQGAQTGHNEVVRLALIIVREAKALRQNRGADPAAGTIRAADSRPDAAAPVLEAVAGPQHQVHGEQPERISRRCVQDRAAQPAAQEQCQDRADLPLRRRRRLQLAATRRHSQGCLQDRVLRPDPPRRYHASDVCVTPATSYVYLKVTVWQ